MAPGVTLPEVSDAALTILKFWAGNRAAVKRHIANSELVFIDPFPFKVMAGPGQWGREVQASGRTTKCYQRYVL
jgi:hypothetical protein